MDAPEVRELFQYAINDGGLYRQRITPIITNLRRKIKRGVYDPSLALKLWKYAADDAAQRYTKEYQTRGINGSYGIFTVAMRQAVARKLADHYDDEMKSSINPKGGTMAFFKGKKQLRIGDIVTDFRGDKSKVLSFEPPHKPGASGYITTTDGRYYASVWDYKWKGNIMQRNPGKRRKASPAQLRARKLFAQRARAGSFSGKPNRAVRRRVKQSTAKHPYFSRLPIHVQMKNGASWQTVAGFTDSARAIKYAKILQRHQGGSIRVIDVR